MHRFLAALLRVGDGDDLPRRIPAMVIGSFCLLFLAGIAAAVVAIRANDAERWVSHTLEVRQVARQLMGALQDAETGQRGYLLTGNAVFLEPYESAQKDLPDVLGRLRAMVSDNAEQSRNLDELAPLVMRRMTGMQQSIDLKREGRNADAADEGRLRAGKTLMDGIRTRFDKVSAIELELLTERQVTAARLRTSFLWALAVSFVASVALALLVARAIGLYLERIKSHAAELEAEAKRRRETEETLRQAQKMEAVGQLTGGIAHDFNNLLTIVMGNLDTVQRRMTSVPPGQEAGHLVATLTKPIEMAVQGCRSAAQLTHRLLAFARRQTLEPVNLDLNRLVGGLSDLLRRTVGEAVQLETVLAGGLWPTLADANQLENALLNLVVNARDAMPSGGKLTIETANAYLDEAYARRFGDVSAGQFVLLSVTDTGTGIASDVLERMFEPFFTTKEAGTGSGLGLAMVHGFVKQSHGHVRIYSEIDRGTTVKIYLPRQDKADQMHAAPVGAEPGLAPLARARQNETVMVVEDNAGVRDYAVAVLEDLGYRVVEAGDAAEALKQFEGGVAVNLLFTDVVLPGGMTGRELATRIAPLRPGLPVLFTTGYTRNAIVHNGTLDANVHLLNKPYTQQELARKIRELLDASAAGARSGMGNAQRREA